MGKKKELNTPNVYCVSRWITNKMCGASQNNCDVRYTLKGGMYCIFLITIMQVRFFITKIDLVDVPI